MIIGFTRGMLYELEQANKRQINNNMVKAMTDKNNRVLKLLDENMKLYPNDYRSSTRYCDAFVDGQIDIEIKQAQRLYNKVMSVQENERNIIMLFGKTASEIIEALEFHEKEKLKMTREEAIKIYIKKNKSDKNVLGSYVTENELVGLAMNEVEALEALGLIKFDEPKTIKDKLEAVMKYTPDCDSPRIHIDTILYWIKESGLELKEKNPK